MARDKRKHPAKPFPPWKSAAPGFREDSFVQVGQSQLLHPAVLNLSDGAFRLYVYMIWESENNKEFSFSRRQYKKICGNSTFQRLKKELCEKGFIDQIESNANLRKKNKYAFSERWKDYNEE